MGNTLTGSAPAQILPVDQYVADVSCFSYVKSLGSTRFIKVASAECKTEGTIVTKVFVIPDQGYRTELQLQREKVEEIKNLLHAQAFNCLPFQQIIETERSIILVRQYVKESLYDRISTRPFLNAVEKRWIAFLLLCAIDQSHKLNVCHGDIKSENVMITSWNWVLLTDFASFKPTYLPEDNPTDFTYFFDTSRRRTCYIAPERFIESSWRSSDSTNLDLTGGELIKGDLTPAMDVFSAGCVIAELFTEGTLLFPFDLSQLLGYRAGEYTPTKIIESIDDVHIRELVVHMIQKNPNDRWTAEQYLTSQHGKAFPEQFYSYLRLYCQRFSIIPILYADERVARIRRDFHEIVENLASTKAKKDSGCLLIIISILTSSIQELRLCESKLVALDLMLRMSCLVPAADIILERLVPYMLFFVSDKFPAVRCEAIRTITKCMSNVSTVPLSDINIFPEYILPAVNCLTSDEVTEVRMVYAENIAVLAEQALRFLEISQLNNMSAHAGSDTTQDDSVYKQASYDSELLALHEMIQEKVVTLLSDPENIVKRTLLENGIIRLCVFFGRQKANDVLLSHMITFLNDKQDWKLRAAFFESIIGVAAYVGCQCSVILRPLLQQGLADCEESVIVKTLRCVKSVMEHKLLDKTVVNVLLKEIVHFLVHPNVWIRQSAVGLISCIAKDSQVADLHCRLLPLLKPFLKEKIIQLENGLVLLSMLKAPLPRPLYDHIIKCHCLEAVLSYLQNRLLIRSYCKHPQEPVYPDPDEVVALTLKKLGSQGLTLDMEEKVVAMADFLLKLHRLRAASVEPSNSKGDIEERLGVVILDRDLNKCRHMDLKCHEVGMYSEGPITMYRKALKKRTLDSPSNLMNEEWKQMFGAVLPTNKSNNHGVTKSDRPSGESSFLDQSTSTLISVTSSTVVLSASGTGNTEKRSDEKLKAVKANCVDGLKKLKSLKCDQYLKDRLIMELMDNTNWDDKPMPSNWKPQGILVAHLHEHRGSVNRIRVSHDHSYFASCSNDGTVKMYDCSRLDGKSITNRSRMTYNKQGGQIKTMCFCDSAQSIASASDSGSIHVFKIESSKSRVDAVHTNNLDVNSEGLVVDMTYFDTGSENIIAYATVHGYLVGWDLRAPKVAWKLENDPKLGLISSFDVHRQLCWLAVGTSSGTHICWDMRFQLPVNTVKHPHGARVRRLLVNQTSSSTILSATQGNNELTMWDMETNTRQKVLWASKSPVLGNQPSHNYTPEHYNGVYLGTSGNNSFVLTAGTDMQIRYWDLDNLSPGNESHIFVGAGSEGTNVRRRTTAKTTVCEGFDVIYETYESQPSIPPTVPNLKLPNSEEKMHGPISLDVSVGHNDVITDLSVCRLTQSYIITSSRDGVIKIWK